MGLRTLPVGGIWAAMLRALHSMCMMAMAVGCNRAPAATGNEAGDGKVLYGQYCAACHGPEGHPPAAMVAQLNVRDLAAPEFRARVTDQLVTEQVRNGSTNKLMPAFGELLDGRQIAAIARYVADASFGRPQ